VRERLAFSEADLPSALRALAATDGVRECLLLSTCNRTEAYLVTAGSPRVREVAGVLGALRGTSVEVFAPYLRVAAGEDAARHVLRVAAGLESMIPGEAQILGQVRRAFLAGREAGTSGAVLHRLMQLALACGRRVRRETGLGQRNASIPHAALALVERVLGGIAGRRVVVVGAGEMGGLAAKVFSQAGAAIAAVANRTPEHARDLARRYGAEWMGLEDLGGRLAGAEVLVVTAGADPPLLGPEVFAAVSGDRPVLVVDIAVPRGVAPDAGRLAGVTLVDLDALTPAAPSPLPPETLATAESIVEDALGVFVRWMASRAAVPVIAALHRRAARIVDSELSRARGRLRGLDERQQRAVRGVVEGALRKLLHRPVVRLRECGDDARVLSVARELFDLDGEIEEEAR